MSLAFEPAPSIRQHQSLRAVVLKFGIVAVLRNPAFNSVRPSLSLFLGDTLYSSFGVYMRSIQLRRPTRAFPLTSQIEYGTTALQSTSGVYPSSMARYELTTCTTFYSLCNSPTQY